MIIRRCDVENRAKCEALVDQRLNDMGFDEREHGPELRIAAKEYYMGLLQDHLDNSDDVIFNGYLDDSEGFVLGFVAGYEACLKNS
jgi:hypothetical protein